MKFRTTRIVGIIAIGLSCFFSAEAQNIKKIAAAYTKALTQTKDLDALISLYADSIDVSDPIWGGQGVYSKDGLSKMYGAVLSNDGGWDYTLLATGIDEKNQVILLRGYVIDEDQRRIDFNSNLTVEGKLITRQTDLVVYPVEDLAHSKRFKAHFRTDLDAQKKKFLDAANGFLKAFKDRDADAFVSAYQDSVLYRDQLYGSSNKFSLQDLKAMFGPLFDPKNNFNFDTRATALDEVNQTVMLKLDFPDPDGGETGEYAGWFRFENGKIVEQLDFSLYPIKDVLESPRFAKYFEEEGLEVKPIANAAGGQSLQSLVKSLVASVENLDVDALMSHYADSVHYQDAIWGADDVFAKATIRGFYEPMLTPDSEADLKILIAAIDEKDNSIMLKGSSYDKTEKGRLPFVVYMRFEKGKIVEQMDFPVYAVESLKNSPRYRPFFK